MSANETNENMKCLHVASWNEYRWPRIPSQHVWGKLIFCRLGRPIAAIYYWRLELNPSLAAEQGWEQADKIFVQSSSVIYILSELLLDSLVKA